MKPYYKTLEVEESSTQEEIKASYRRLSKKWHPDKNQDPDRIKEFESKQRKISEAYSVLGKPEKRLLYDQLGIDCTLSKMEELANKNVLDIFKGILKEYFAIDQLFIIAQKACNIMLEELKSNKMEAEYKITGLERRVVFLENVANKKIAKGMNHLRQAINQEIISVEDEISEIGIEEIDLDIAVSKKTLDILKAGYPEEMTKEEYFNDLFKITHRTGTF